MTRRRFIALVGLCVLTALGGLVVAVGVIGTQSEWGEHAMRGWIERRVGANLNGKVHLGRIGGNFLTGVTIDSLELRDDEDSLVVATGRIVLQYDPRDLVDRRLWFRSVRVEHPAVVLRQHENWTWNYKRLFNTGSRTKTLGPERGFGDFVILDSVHIGRGASLRVTIPWHADDSLKGSRRDSAERANVARRDHEIRRTREGLTQTYRWTNGYGVARHVRVAHPDSVGKLIVVDTLHAVQSMPPFTWRNVAATVRVVGDSAWFSSPHWDLPGSTGRAGGKVVWGSDLPVRYAVRVVGDSVSLADVAWVYPTLPRTGGGRLVLDINNERDLRRIDYAIKDMDVRTTRSRLRGALTFETGGPVLTVHDVKLRADPLDFDLLRTLNGKPFPANWQGTLTGSVTARGGPLTDFYVDAAEFTFNDANVPGAVSRLKGRGALDILYPAFTAFRNFSASTDRFDLRTLVAIYPAFPRIGGIVSGRAVLDSSWLDVRVSNADLVHVDGPADPTRATGGGRITYGDQFMIYDMSLQAAPLSLTTLARSYPTLPLRGSFSGPMRIRGAAPDLDVQADLSGSAGRLVFAGRVDADSLGGYGARGTGSFDGLDALNLLGRATPPSRLFGSYDVDLVGESLADLLGSVSVRLAPSTVDGLRVTSATARMAFERGVARIDTLGVVGDAGVLRARGTIGLTRTSDDSLVLAYDADSLGGLRRYLRRADSAVPRSPAIDSIAGSLSFRGLARGQIDSLELRGDLMARALAVGGNRAQRIAGNVAMSRVRGRLTGDVDLRAETVRVGGIRIADAGLAAHVIDADHTRFTSTMRGENGSLLRTAGVWRAAADTSAVRLDTLSLRIGSSRWGLLQPLRFTQSATGIAVDTVVFTDGGLGRVTGFVDVPADAPARIVLRADSVPLADFATLAQLPTPLAGRLSMAFEVAGNRTRPTMTLSATARELKYGGLDAEVVSVSGRYGDARAVVDANILRGGSSLLDATVSYPIALTLFSARTTGDSLRGRIRADSVDLALVEALSTKFRRATGRLGLDLTLSGQPDRPHVGGRATIRDGAIELPDVGVRLAEVDGEIGVDAASDSLFTRMRWTSPASNGRASLQGSVIFRDIGNPRLDLRLDAAGFRAVDKRGLARLDVSTGPSGLTLAGTPAQAVLSGAVRVDRGTIYIPELVRKQVVDLSLSDFAQLYDTSDARNKSLMPQPPGAFIEHLRLDGVSVRLGDEVWLRSREASIKLGGSLNVTRARNDRVSARSNLARDARTDSARYSLALAGSLSADRGTYTLDLTAVQREFQVQSGRITFFGTPDFNPEIDVTALYQVKQANRSDVGVRARIHGNFFPQPALELSSTDAYLSPSDLVSYLVTGRPSFELVEQNAATQRAFQFLLPTAGAYVSRVLRDQLGEFVDLFQIQSGAVSDQPASTAASTNSQFRSFLSSTRLGGEKQISDRLFLSFSTGLCQLGGTSDDASQQGLNGFVSAIEGKLEYRFPLLAPDRLALRAGREPAASALRCGAGNVRGFVATPQQWGFSLFRSWVF